MVLFITVNGGNLYPCFPSNGGFEEKVSKCNSCDLNKIWFVFNSFTLKGVKECNYHHMIVSISNASNIMFHTLIIDGF